MNVSTYWTLPPTRQGKIRQKVEKAEKELQRIVGHYTILEEKDSEIEFLLFCSKCYRADKWSLCSLDEYTPITKEEYLKSNHIMHGEKCERCDKPLG